MGIHYIHTPKGVNGQSPEDIIAAALVPEHLEEAITVVSTGARFVPIVYRDQFRDEVFQSLKAHGLLDVESEK